MNVALRVPMTLEQFLAWEERQEERYEFDGKGPVAMNGGTAAHSTIQTNLIAALATRLRGTPCRVHGSHLKIEVVGRIRYPDAFVVCTPVPSQAKVVADPVVVFEILSDSTAENDLFAKNMEYRDTPSIQRYVILQQQPFAAMVLSHRGGAWAVDHVIGPQAVLSLPPISVEIPLAEIYDGVEPEPDPPA